MSIKDSDGVVVLGNDSSNPLNNVTIRTPAVPNGSLEVFQGVPGNLGTKILDLDENKIGINTETLETALNQNVLGMGQTWQDFTQSRKINTTYTNTTGRPIIVSISGWAENEGADIILTVGGFPVAASFTGTSGTGTQATAVVPNGSHYKVSEQYGGWHISSWMELR